MNTSPGVSRKSVSIVHRILRFSVRQRFLTVALGLAIGILGFWSFSELAIDAVPDVTNKQVQINTAVEGLSPVEIEKQITFPIEWAMQGVPGVEEIRSVSFYGVSQVSVVFRDDIDLYRARQLVSERLIEAKESLPEGVGTPFLGPIWTGLGEIFFWSVEASGPKKDGSQYTPMDLKVIQDWIVKPQLRGIPGVTEINTIGGHEKQFHVRPDLRKLVAFGVTFRDILDALGENNANVGGGFIEHRGEQYTIRSIARLASVDDIRNVKLGAHEGVPFFIKDVAEVGLGHELRTGAGTVNGEEAVIGTAILLYGDNSRTVSQRVAKKLKEIGPNLPENVVIRTLYDRTYLVDATIATVRKNLVEGAILVVAVLFALLGNARGALIVALAIPLSMLFAATGMAQTKISANLMSLGAIDFGIIVDGAVVMIENIVRRIGVEQHALGRPLKRKERFVLVVNAAEEVARPIIFGVVIIMIVYLPILTLSGVEGKMFRPMAEVVLLALAGALLFTFTVIPALAALLLRGRLSEKEPSLLRFARTLYLPILQFALKRPAAIVVPSLMLLALCAALAFRIGSEFIPRLGEGALALQPSRAPSIALTTSIGMQKELEKALLREFPDEIESVFARTGTSEVVTDVCGPEVSDTYITLRPRHHWKRASDQTELAEAMEGVVKNLPGQTFEFSQPIELRMNELISGVRSDLAVKVYGEDLSLMSEYARRIADELREVPGAQDIKIEQTTGMPMINIRLDQALLARYGLNARDAQQVIETALGGTQAGYILDGDKRFELVVRLPESARGNIDAIGALPIAIPDHEQIGGIREERAAVRNASPGYIPLSSVARISTTEGARQIRREDGRRRVVVTANVRGRDLGSFVSEAQARIERKPGRLPEGYWIGWGGQYEHLIAGQRRLMLVVPLALGLIFALLFATFGAFKPALLVFTGVPLALTGGILSLWLRDIPFSISAGIGFIALSGVAVLNGLVLVTFISQLRATSASVEEAVVQGCLTRLRPVLMTGLVASLGFLPMALATGMGSEVQRPLATVVMGGILSSTILTLLVLPVLYHWIEGRDDADEIQ